MRDSAQILSNCTFGLGPVRGAGGANIEKGMQSEDWKQDARVAWKRLQNYISNRKQLQSENIGNNKSNNAMLAKSKAALYTHTPNDGLEQKNRKIIYYVKKVPRYHINRKHNVKYWYEEPAVGMRKKP
ncbi:hypothetical protein chiPu_0006566 [Chiloscyllium punctatum]|uniref:Uncharacterized protein n=1 Tax=Chiloscyllium punctatum TaxID=137246 RepID=A0A401SCK3_CHIPU|nr:hypothetical protein [Chiloscyllium punctatum]